MWVFRSVIARVSTIEPPRRASQLGRSLPFPIRGRLSYCAKMRLVTEPSAHPTFETVGSSSTGIVRDSREARRPGR
jgi:hypothetical protein